MRKVYVDQLQAGMTLGKAIYNERGDVLLARDVRLTAEYIAGLRARGFYAVYVLDGIADDVEPPDIVSDRVRMATYRHVHDLFDIVHGASLCQVTDSSADVPPEFSGIVKPLLSNLYRDVEKIIDEVTSIPTLSGVVSLKSHDSYTFEHSVEVTVAGVLLGERLNMQGDELRQLALGCLCHDLGKMVVPVDLLNKPGRLDAQEFELVRQHPRAGYEAMRRITGGGDIIARHVAWQHHERQDGTGYPRGLRGTNQFHGSKPSRFGERLMLPAAEIAAIADVYCALASDRPYRPALPPTEVATTLQQMAGNHLNRQIVTLFLSILPSYPVGTEVVVIAGRLRGYRGIVAETNPRDIQRPRIRILFDPRGLTISPFEVNTSRETDIQIAVCSRHRCGDSCHLCSLASQGTRQRASDAA